MTTTTLVLMLMLTLMRSQWIVIQDYKERNRYWRFERLPTR